MMKKYFIFLNIEIKRILKIIPQIFIGAIVLSLLMGTIAFCGNKALYNSTNNKATIAYSVDDDNIFTNSVVSILSKSKSISRVCKFIQMNKEEALRLLSDGKVLSVFCIPEGFMTSLDNGSNFSISIYLSATVDIYSLVFIELAHSAESLLDSAQSGIYALHDFYKDNNLLSYEYDDNIELNDIYLSKVFIRKNTFTEKIVTAAVGFSMIQYYLSAGIVLLFMFLGIIFVSFIHGYTKITEYKLLQNKFTYPIQILGKIIPIAFIYSIMLSIIFLVLRITQNSILKDIKINLFNLPLYIIILSLAFSSFIVLLANIAHSANTGILLIFIITIVMGFISGYFIPDMFLPDSICFVSKYLPTTHFLLMLEYLLDGKLIMSEIFYTFTFSIICFLFTVFIKKVKFATEKGDN